MTQQEIAIVTGANRGLGKETAKQLAENGMLVYLTAREFGKAQETADNLANSNLIPAQLDVTDPNSVDQLYQRVWAAMLPKDGPTGGFFRDGEPISW